MIDDLNKMEAEVDAMLASLSLKLAVGPSPAAIERTKSAVRHQMNESWLAEQPAPMPSSKALQQVREAVDHELKKRMPHAWLRPRIWAPLAAAAIIAICVGLINYTRTPLIQQPAAVDLDVFVQAFEEAFEENSFTMAANMDLDAIEDSINNLANSNDYEYEIINDIGNQIDELFNQPDWLENVSTGAIG